jgi:hypothetical protein
MLLIMRVKMSSFAMNVIKILDATSTALLPNSSCKSMQKLTRLTSRNFHGQDLSRWRKVHDLY